MNAQVFTVSGQIVDSTNNRTISHANIYELSNKKGVSTDINGKFEIRLKQTDKFRFEISHIEYKKCSFSIDIHRDTTLIIALLPQIINLEDITITSYSGIKNVSKTQFGAKQINEIPALAGEKDILKALQLSPGVLSGNEGTVGLSVRGGGEDQNLYLIDNMPIYSPSHLLGFFSTFNPDIIQQTELVRAGIPANYGGKLSSVINIQAAEPSYKKIQGNISLGLISAKAYAEIPIIKNKSGLMISARRSYFDLLSSIQAVMTDADDLKKIGFFDMDIKYQHTFDPKNILSLQYLYSNDYYYNLFGDNEREYKDKSGIDWANQTLFVNYKHIAEKYGTMSILAGINDYNYNYLNENYNGEGTLENGYQKTSSIKDYVIKSAWSYNINQQIDFVAGVSYTFHQTVPQNLLIMNVQKSQITESSNEVAVFSQFNFNLKNKDILSFGLRQNIYLHDSVADFPIEPRFSYIKAISKFSTIKISLSRNIQFVHRVEDFSTGLPTELWYIANNRLKYEESYQSSIELNHAITKFNINIGAAIYYKWMNNLVEHGNYYADLPLPEGIDNHLTEGGGNGRTYGLELFCNKPYGNLTYSLNYLISKSERKFPNINNADWYPSSTDRLHNFNTTISYKLNEKLLFTLAWIYSTGKPITVPEGRYYTMNENETTRYFIGDRNNYRLADYHRLDLSVQYKKIKRHGTSTLEFGLYNAYNRKNPYSIDFEDEKILVEGSVVKTGKVIIKQYSLFPIIPSISYKRNF